MRVPDHAWQILPAWASFGKIGRRPKAADPKVTLEFKPARAGTRLIYTEQGDYLGDYDDAGSVTTMSR